MGPNQTDRDRNIKADHESDAIQTDQKSRPTLTTRAIAWRLFVTCWLIYTLHFATNTVREIYPALSLGDHLSFDVSEYVGLHPDIFLIPDRGAFINNNPGASILGAVPYIIFRPAIDYVVSLVESARASTGNPPPEYDTIYPLARQFYRAAYERGLDIKFGLAAGVMVAFLMAPISALSVTVMFRVLVSSISLSKALLLSILYAFATPVFFRTAQLNHNLLVAHFAFFAFVLLWRPWDKSGLPRRSAYFLAGLLAGFTIILDYSGVIVILAITMYALLRWKKFPAPIKSKTDILVLASGILICIIFLMGYQWFAFGNPFYPPQHYMPPTTFSVFGFAGIDFPQLDLLILNAFGLRYGLFISAPFLLLALYFPAWFRDRSNTNSQPRLLGNFETWFIILYSLAFFLFTAANQFSRMQFNTGVRHIVPVVPFLFLLAAGVFLLLPAWIAGLVAIISVYWSWSLAMYRDVEGGLGIFESLIQITSGGLRLPWLTTLHNLGLAPGWLSPTPILILFTGLIFVIWLIRFPSARKKDKSSSGTSSPERA